MITLTLFAVGFYLQGYRYLAGIGVAAFCESAITYYRKVSNKGKILHFL